MSACRVWVNGTWIVSSSNLRGNNHFDDSPDGTPDEAATLG